jgi:hypothetical protein
MSGVTLGAYDPGIDLSMMDDPDLALHFAASETDLV